MVGIKLEDEILRDFVKKGRKSARELTRARILLLAIQQKGDTKIADSRNIRSWQEYGLENQEKIP